MSNTYRDIYTVCPKCWSSRVKSRTFKIPRYKCEVCGKEFMNKTRITREERKEFNTLLRYSKKEDIPDTIEISERSWRIFAVNIIKEHQERDQ